MKLTILSEPQNIRHKERVYVQSDSGAAVQFTGLPYEIVVCTLHLHSELHSAQFIITVDRPKLKTFQIQPRFLKEQNAEAIHCMDLW